MAINRRMVFEIEGTGPFTTLKAVDYPREAYSVCIRMVVPGLNLGASSNVLHFHYPPDALVETPREEWPREVGQPDA